MRRLQLDLQRLRSPERDCQCHNFDITGLQRTKRPPRNVQCRNNWRRRRVVSLEEGVFALQERIMKTFAVAVIALSALLSGCVAYETPAYDRSASYGDRD